MAMIFPGMDPYLEDPRIWPGVHNTFLVYLCDHLQPLLRPRYFATVEERVFVEEVDRVIIPDVAIQRTAGPARHEAVAVAGTDEPVIVHVDELEIHESYLEIYWIALPASAWSR